MKCCAFFGAPARSTSTSASSGMPTIAAAAAARPSRRGEDVVQEASDRDRQARDGGQDVVVELGDRQRHQRVAGDEPDRAEPEDALAADLGRGRRPRAAAAAPRTRRITAAPARPARARSRAAPRSRARARSTRSVPRSPWRPTTSRRQWLSPYSSSQNGRPCRTSIAWCHGIATTAQVSSASRIAKPSCARLRRFQFQVNARYARNTSTGRPRPASPFASVARPHSVAAMLR